MARPFLSTIRGKLTFMAGGLVVLTLGLDFVLRALRLSPLWAAFITLMVGVLSAAWISRDLTRALDKVKVGALRVGSGHLSERVVTSRYDELGDLAEAFNVMSRRLEELDRLKDSFLAMITHDLRTPLSTILGWSTVLRQDLDGRLEPNHARGLETIEKSGRYLSDLVDNILDVAQMEAGRASFKPAAVDVSALAREVVEHLSIVAADYGVSLDASAVPPGLGVTYDPQALRRVLINLFSNALKFTPKGGSARLVHARIADGHRFGVADTGIGIPAERVGQLFQKFAQVEETKNVVRQVTGTGLGLVVCKDVVEAHGGRIWVESEYGKGTTFYFTVPAAAPA